MNICIIQNITLTEHLALSTYLRNIVKYLSILKDIEIQLIVQKGSKKEFAQEENVTIHYAKGNSYSVRGNIRFMLEVMNKICKINREREIDIIHALYPNSSVLGILASKSINRLPSGLPVLYDIRSPWINMGVERDDIPKSLGRIAYSFEKSALKRVDGAIFITKKLEEFYGKIIDFQIFSRVIPSGVDFKLFYSQNQKGEKIRKKFGFNNSIIVGYVGSLHPMRELGFLIRAFKNLTNNSTKDFKLIFVGDGPDMKNLKHLTEKSNLRNKILFVGQIPYEKVGEWISAFDIGISHLPNKLIFKYSFPLKVLEYMACGKPVLASNIQAHEEVITPGKTGMLYSPNSIESFVNSLQMLSSLPSSKTTKQCIEYAKHFSWENISKSLCDFYRDLLRLGLIEPKPIQERYCDSMRT